MSKNKKKSSSSELEDLKHENKELRSINKSLQREIRKLSKEVKPEYSQDQLIQEEMELKEPKTFRCHECERGVITKVELGAGRYLESCTICKYRKLLKNATQETKV